MKPEKLWTRDFIVGTLANFALLVNYYMLMVVMTGYVLDTYDAPASVAAFCASIFIVGTLVSRFVSGAVMERIGRKRMLMIGAVCEMLFSALYLLGTALPLLLCVRFCHGLSYGMCSTALATIVTSIVPNARKGEGIGYYMLSVTLGAAIGPFVGIIVSNNLDFRLLFILATAMAILALLASLTIRVKKPLPNSSSNELTETIAENEPIAAELDAPEDDEVLLDAASIEDSSGKNTNAASPIPVQDKQKLNSSTPSRKTGYSTHTTSKVKRDRSFLDTVIETKVIPISLVCSLIFFGYSSLLTFLTPYADELGLTRAASVFFIVYAIIMFITRPFTGKAFDRKGPKPVMIPAFLSFALGMITLSFATNDWILLASALLLGFGVGTIQSCGLAMAVRATVDERLSLANSTFYIFIDTGVGVGPVILGMLVPLIGYQFMFQCMALVAVISLGFFMLLVRKDNKRPSDA